MNNHAFLQQIEIAKPCPANWDEMTGDERARFCSHCQKNVYNLSAMTAHDAAELIRAKEGKLCVRLYRRRDGTVLTSDCPVGVREHWRRMQRSIVTAAATVVAALTGCRGAASPPSGNSTTNAIAGTPSIPVMGDIAPRVMGEIYIPPTNSTPANTLIEK